jgi:hypothetical protein
VSTHTGLDFFSGQSASWPSLSACLPGIVAPDSINDLPAFGYQEGAQKWGTVSALPSLCIPVIVQTLRELPIQKN